MKKGNKESEVKSMVKYEEVGNIEDMVFVILVLFLKQTKNVRKLMATNY